MMCCSLRCASCIVYAYIPSEYECLRNVEAAIPPILLGAGDNNDH